MGGTHGEFANQSFSRDHLMDCELNLQEFEMKQGRYVIPQNRSDDYTFMSDFVEAIWDEDAFFDATVHFDQQVVE